jgi:hypothetical protein
MILTFLQNAWFHRPLHKGYEVDENGRPRINPETGRGYPIPIPEWSDDWREIWLFATVRSRSGQRLKLMLGDDCFERDDCAFADASPKVSYGSSAGAFPGDPDWVRSELAKYRPSVVVCCGNTAIDTVSPLWPGGLIAVPHPTSRVVTNALYRDAGVHALKRGQRRRLRFYQLKGGIDVQELPAIAAPQ